MKTAITDKISAGLDAADGLLLVGLAVLVAGAFLTFGAGPALVLVGVLMVGAGVALAWLRREDA